jgi:hypothetical protein
MEPSAPAQREPPAHEPTIRDAENALRRLGYARVPPQPAGGAGRRAQFWVQEPGVPRRVRPVFVDAAPVAVTDLGGPGAILVVPDERRAEAVWERLRTPPHRPSASEVAILVLRPAHRQGEGPYWHSGTVDRRELLALATGIIVGLFRRAHAGGEGGQVDFEEMLQLLRLRYHIDVEESLGVGSNEDALWMMYQLALRFAYAPGDPSANLHLLVLKPTGPAARLPWFAG